MHQILTHFQSMSHNMATIVYIRGAPISKLTDISAIKSTDSDTNTDITTSMGSSLLLLQMLQI